MCPKITLYVLPNCPSCEVAKYILGKLGVEYEVKNIDGAGYNADSGNMKLVDEIADREGQAPFLVIEKESGNESGR